ncbi:MAG: hypothetical protein AABY15_09650 [Nanoarchaeota archaeon]
MAEKYSAESIKVLEGLEGVRKRFDVIELSKKVKRKGDLLILSNELKIRPRILNSAIDEGRILSILPNIHKSKAGILARLRTDRELKLFAQKYDIYNLPARKLIKFVREWNQEIQKNPLIFLSQEEHDLITGSLMGDSSIRQREKNSCFRFSHSIKQKRYSEWKRDILRNFNISEFREVKRRIGKRFIHAVDFATKTHPIFNYYRDLFYKNERKVVTEKILSQLSPQSLAIWICDDGSYENKQGYIILCTNSYTLEEHKLMQEFFNKKFALNPTIGFRDKKYYYLRFKQDDTKKLIKIIKPFIPKSMLYKIGEKSD